MKYKNEQLEGQIDIFDILYPDRKPKREEEVKNNDKTSNCRTNVISNVHCNGDYIYDNDHPAKKGISERR